MPPDTLCSIDDIRATRDNFPPDLIIRTPLTLSTRLSEQHGRPVYLKDETQQPVRSYKGRGAFTKMLRLSAEKRGRGVVCASAGNHAQGVASACNFFQIQGVIFMPTTTPPQKIEATRRHGNGYVDIKLIGDTFDDTAQAAQQHAAETEATFIHPFDDPDVIRGQATVGLEIWEQMQETSDRLGTVIVPIGGGGLAAGTTRMLELDDQIELLGVEPAEASSMTASLRVGYPVTLDHLDTFVDGAAVKRPGDLTFSAVTKAVRSGRMKMTTVSKGLLCETMTDLLQIDGTLTEPAGALSVAALSKVGSETHDAVVCILTGNNFDMHRIPLVLEKAAFHRRTRTYVSIHLPDRPGALLEMMESMRYQMTELNITFMHYDDNQDNGDPPLHIGVESKTGKPQDINTFLHALRSQNDGHGQPRYPFNERDQKPKV